ncbi:MAG: hypothetical protein J0M08_06805 [Bacteroidetes bacterium]|nr:hypothetical protein [Bacteroidota bacterium]
MQKILLSNILFKLFQHQKKGLVVAISSLLTLALLLNIKGIISFLAGDEIGVLDVLCTLLFAYMIIDLINAFALKTTTKTSEPTDNAKPTEENKGVETKILQKVSYSAKKTIATSPKSILAEKVSPPIENRTQVPTFAPHEKSEPLPGTEANLTQEEIPVKETPLPEAETALYSRAYKRSKFV